MPQAQHIGIHVSILRATGLKVSWTTIAVGCMTYLTHLFLCTKAAAEVAAHCGISDLSFGAGINTYVICSLLQLVSVLRTKDTVVPVI
jgi:hypothetical protein